ncbi:MAG: GNAT family N-acetyltransferase [Candidatus Limnocylindrales bacterium]
MSPAVVLRDITTEDEFEAVMGLRRGPGQDRYLGMMISHFEDAIVDARAMPRSWSVHDVADGTLVGFTMISDNIPAATLAADPDLIGPYYLWRLLIDHRFQGRGYGAATLDAVAAYVRARPGGDVLWTSCAPGDGSPEGFYRRYGFTPVDRIVDGEQVLRLDLASAPNEG